MKLENNARKSCFGWCPDGTSRGWLIKELSRKSIVISELHDDGNFNEVSYPSPGKEYIPSGDFQNFESRKSVMYQIVELLKCDGQHTVSVYVMRGIGKTTLVKEAGKKAKEESFLMKW